MPGPSQQVHLAVLVHGMWGYPGHLAEATRIMTETHVLPTEDKPDDVQVRLLVSNANAQEHTYDGIDWGGERVAEEVSTSQLDKQGSD